VVEGEVVCVVDGEGEEDEVEDVAGFKGTKRDLTKAVQMKVLGKRRLGIYCCWDLLDLRHRQSAGERLDTTSDFSWIQAQALVQPRRCSH
jgi:hypothetical protein